MKKRLHGIFIIIILIFSSILISGKMEEIKDNIDLNNLTLKQKIAQMFIIQGNEKNLDLTEFNVGGIILGEFKTKEDYKKLISEYNNKSKIKLFVSADLEGYWNPFHNFAKFPNADEIKTKEEAYELGKEHGEILKELGFNLNFAPVAEIKDNVWKHRAFLGNTSEISGKINYYVKGLQEQGILATLKHYPGGSLNIKDPHLQIVKSEISQEQMEVFNSVLTNTSSIMIGHAIDSGEINSNGKSKFCLNRSNLNPKNKIQWINYI